MDTLIHLYIYIYMYPPTHLASSMWEVLGTPFSIFLSASQQPASQPASQPANQPLKTYENRENPWNSMQ